MYLQNIISEYVYIYVFYVHLYVYIIYVHVYKYYVCNVPNI